MVYIFRYKTVCEIRIKNLCSTLIVMIMKHSATDGIEKFVEGIKNIKEDSHQYS